MTSKMVRFKIPHKRILCHFKLSGMKFFNHPKFHVMNKVSLKKQKKKNVATFSLVNPNSAGVDIADKEMAVAVPTDRSTKPVRFFGSFTCDLHRIAEWLKSCNISTVAMESTGVYWVQLFLILQDYGFEVYLVNSSHVKNVTGRKSDESDAMWIQKLHSCGLLRNSFQPDNATRTLRSLVRHRKSLVRNGAAYVNRMQKALEQMNIKVHTVISDILGKTGTSIIKAILSGERDAEILAGLANSRIKASKEEMVKSLEGDWREEHLFELKHYHELYAYHQVKIKECNQQIERQLLKQIAAKNQGDISFLDTNEINSKRGKKNQMDFDLTHYLKSLLGVDPTEIFGISEISVLEIVAETGTDMSKWASEKHFTSWLGLAPNNKISGGKIISSRIMKKKHNAGQAFRIAANSLYRSQNPLGDFYRRIKAKQGAGKAVVATARKIAVIYYNMLIKKEGFNPKQLLDFQERYKQKKIRALEKRLMTLKEAS
jgi:transposase